MGQADGQSDDPAAMTFHIGLPGEPKHLCYAHAAQEDFLELPLGKIEELSDRLGIGRNGITFVLEVVCSNDVSSAKDVTRAIIRAARSRFKVYSVGVFAAWGMMSNSDIGRVLGALVETDLLPPIEGVSLDQFDDAFTLMDMLDAP